MLLVGYIAGVVWAMRLKMWPDLGKPEKTQLKIFTMFLKLRFFAHLDKETIKPSCYEISHQKFDFPRRYGWLHQINQCAQKVGFPKSGQNYALLSALQNTKFDHVCYYALLVDWDWPFSYMNKLWENNKQ